MTAGSKKDMEAWLSIMARPWIEEPELGWDNMTGQVQLYEVFGLEPKLIVFCPWTLVWRPGFDCYFR